MTFRKSLSYLPLWLALLALQPAVHAQPQATIWDGIYTNEQAVLGKEVYDVSCVACHSADLRGNSNAPSLLGMSFMFLWEGRSIGELFTTIRTTMPSENPGSLPAQSYLNVLVYILQVNNFPDGEIELEMDQARIDAIMIEPDPGC